MSVQTFQQLFVSSSGKFHLTVIVLSLYISAFRYERGVVRECHELELYNGVPLIKAKKIKYRIENLKYFLKNSRKVLLEKLTLSLNKYINNANIIIFVQIFLKSFLLNSCLNSLLYMVFGWMPVLLAFSKLFKNAFISIIYLDIF